MFDLFYFASHLKFSEYWLDKIKVFDNEKWVFVRIDESSRTKTIV